MAEICWHECSSHVKLSDFNVHKAHYHSNVLCNGKKSLNAASTSNRAASLQVVSETNRSQMLHP